MATAISLKNCTLKIKDGGSNYVDITIGTGNFTFTVAKENVIDLDRGLIATASIVDGDDVPMEVNFECIWDYYTSSSSSGALVSPIDALRKVGEASDWQTTDSDECNNYAVDLELTYTPNCVTGDIEVLTFPDFRPNSISCDLSARQISVAGVCKAIAPTAVRTPQGS